MTGNKSYILLFPSAVFKTDDMLIVNGQACIFSVHGMEQPERFQTQETENTQKSLVYVPVTGFPSMSDSNRGGRLAATVSDDSIL